MAPKIAIVFVSSPILIASFPILICGLSNSRIESDYVPSSSTRCMATSALLQKLRKRVLKRLVGQWTFISQ